MISSIDWTVSFSSSDIPEQIGNGIYDQTNEFHCLPSITSMTVNQIDTPTRESNGSFEDEDADQDQIDNRDFEQTNQENYIKAYVLYDFNGKYISRKRCIRHDFYISV